MKTLFAFLMIIVPLGITAQVDYSNAPSASGDAVTIGQNTYQIESKFQFTEINGVHEIDFPSNLVMAGIDHKFELRLTNGVSLRGTQFDIAPISIGCKTQLLTKSESNNQLALLLDVQLPIINRNSSVTNEFLAFNQSIGKRNNLGITIGAGYESTKRETDYKKRSNVDLAVIYGCTLHPKCTIYTSFYGSLVNDLKTRSETFGASSDIGILFLLSKSIEINYALGFGIYENMHYHALGFNFTLQPNK